MKLTEGVTDAEGVADGGSTEVETDGVCEGDELGVGVFEGDGATRGCPGVEGVDVMDDV